MVLASLDEAASVNEQNRWPAERGSDADVRGLIHVQQQILGARSAIDRAGAVNDVIDRLDAKQRFVIKRRGENRRRRVAEDSLRDAAQEKSPNQRRSATPKRARL